MMKYIKRTPHTTLTPDTVYAVVDETDDDYCVEVAFDFATPPRKRMLRLWWAKKDCVEVRVVD